MVRFAVLNEAMRSFLVVNCSYVYSYGIVLCVHGCMFCTDVGVYNVSLAFGTNVTTQVPYNCLNLSGIYNIIGINGGSLLL